MTAIGPASSRSRIVVDPQGRAVADPATYIIAEPRGPLGGERWVWALPLNAAASVTKRYQPDHPPEEACVFGMDLSFVVPYGVGLVPGGASLAIFTNSANPVAAGSDWQQGPVGIFGRGIYALMSGGVLGTDYQFRWLAVDTDGNTWQRTALVLCAQTS